MKTRFEYRRAVLDGIDKAALVEAIAEQLASELDGVKEAAKAAHEGATHEDSKPENQYDTRALEASYLAGAQAARVQVLDAAIQVIRQLDLRSFDDGRPITLSALIGVEHDDGTERYFLSPVGGGIKVPHEGGPIRVVTPESPLGKRLMKKRVGDTFELTIKKQKRDYEIIACV